MKNEKRGEMERREAAPTANAAPLLTAICTFINLHATTDCCDGTGQSGACVCVCVNVFVSAHLPNL